MKKFQEIVYILAQNKLLVEADARDCNVLDITFDSKQVKKDSLFVAKGLNFKDQYMDQAVQMGASSYMAEKKFSVEIPHIIVNDIRKAMLVTAQYFFDHPENKLKLIGVTGTKGKSTTVNMLKKIIDLKMAAEGKKPAGIISTISTYDGVNEYPSKLSTPEAIDLYRNLSNAVKSGLEYMIVEVSSQALKYHRVGGTGFNVAVILNIGQDHIGEVEHPTLEDYINSKLKIVDLSENIVYYKASENIEKIEEAVKGKNSISYDINDDSADYNILNIQYIDDINTFDVRGKLYKIAMFGDFNVANACASIAVCDYFDIDYKYIFAGLESFRLASRSSVFHSKDDKIIAIVDYSHNKLSMEKNLEFFKRKYPDYAIHTIFGASGGKGLNRRVDLPLTASKFSDRLYLVPDDPGFEDIMEINRQLAANITNDLPYQMFETREMGIIQAVKDIVGKTIIFAAGKGGESYQKIKGGYQKIKSDLDVVTGLLEKYDKNIK